MTSPRRPRTIVTHLGEDPGRYQGAVTPPIYETSTFAFPSFDALQAAYAGDESRYRYSRRTNPTVEIVETKLAALEGGDACACFGSGMAAVSAALLALLRAGDHVVAVQNLYSDTYQWLEKWAPRFEITHAYVTGTSADEIAEALRPETRLVYLESPTSLLFELQDIRGITALCRERGIPTIMDNSWATPYFQQPLAFGVDLSVHSATKYLGGHSDILGGAVIGRADLISRVRGMERALLGGILAPFEGWLLLRGLRTLPLRMEAHQAAALEVARHLDRHPRVRRVNHPGLPSHPHHALARAQMTGTSGLFSIELDTDAGGVRRFSDALRMILLGVSWGGHESLAFPVASGDAAHRKALPASLVRLSIGLEDPVDLIEDLDRALAAI